MGSVLPYCTAAVCEGRPATVVSGDAGAAPSPSCALLYSRYEGTVQHMCRLMMCPPTSLYVYPAGFGLHYYCLPCFITPAFVAQHKGEVCLARVPGSLCISFLQSRPYIALNIRERPYTICRTTTQRVMDHYMSIDLTARQPAVLVESTSHTI